MPIYEYKCDDCGEIVEIFHRTPAQTNVRCSRCGSESLQKIFSVPAAVRVAGSSSSPGTTCCGREERCDAPPCSVGEGCRRDR